VKEEEFEALRHWGEALSRDGRPEVAAAGKAIEILVAEIDRLEIELWHTRVGIARQPVEGSEGAPPEGTDGAAPQLDAELEAEVRSTRSRVRRLLLSARTRRSSVSPPS
jgi:hypothetical protein